MRATSASAIERKRTMSTGRHFDTCSREGGCTPVGTHFAPAPARPAVSARAAVCTAGLSLALALTASPLAPTHAYATGADVPDAGWTPDLPSIDGSETGGTTGGGESGGSGTGGESGGTATPDINPGGDTGGSDTGSLPADGTDTPSYVPTYDETYGGGSTSSYAASPAAFADPAASTETSAGTTPAADAAQAAVAAPVISGWDAATRTVTGTAAAGATVRATDAQGNVVAEAQVGEDGTFSLTLPEGTTLADVTLATVDASGASSSAASGATYVSNQAAKERSRVSAEVASTVAGLAANVSADIADSGMGTGYAQPQSSALPLMPYVLGAAAGIAGAGVAVAGVWAIARGRREQTGRPDVASARPSGAAAQGAVDMDAISMALAELTGEKSASDEAFAPAVPAPAHGSDSATPASAPASAAPRPDSTEAFLAVYAAAHADESAAHASEPTPAPASAPAPASPADTITRLAPLGAEAGPSVAQQTSADPGVTPAADAIKSVSPEDTAAFIALLAGDGTSGGSDDDDDPRPPRGGAPAPAPAPQGGPAPVSSADLPASAPSVTQDASGLDAWSGELVAPSAEEGEDPLASGEDWRAIALAELTADDEPEPERTSAADSTVSHTMPRVSVPEAQGMPYVAPVVGPASSSSIVSALRESGRLGEVQEALEQAVRARDAAKAQAAASLSSLPDLEPAHEVTSAFAAVPAQSEISVTPGFVPTARHFASQASGRATASAATGLVPAGLSDESDDEFSSFATPSGVPQITRGFSQVAPGGVSCVVPDMGDDEFSDDISAYEPPVTGFGRAPVSPAQRLQSSLAPSAAAYDARVAAAQAASAHAYGYAPASTPAFDAYGETPTYTYGYGRPYGAPARVQPVAHAYAPAPTSAFAARTSRVPAVFGEYEQLPETDAVTYSTDIYRTDPLTPEYISYLVDDEFAHRHDSPAQRAAATGQFRVVMGAPASAHAQGPARPAGAKHFA